MGSAYKPNKNPGHWKSVQKQAWEAVREDIWTEGHAAALILEEHLPPLAEELGVDDFTLPHNQRVLEREITRLVPSCS